MMEGSVRHTGAEGGKNNGLESYSSNIGKSSAVRDNTAGEFDREEDDGEPSHSNSFHGKQNGVQHSLNSYEKTDGCCGCDIDARQRLDDVDGMDDQMEFDGGSGTTPSV